MEKDNNERKMTRRKFLTFTTGVPLVLSVVSPLALIGGTLEPPAALKPIPPEMAVVKEGDVKDKPVEFVYDGTPAILFARNGEFHAFSRVCSHLGCIVMWNAQKQQFECPCHGGIYNADGDVVKGPPPKPLLRLATWVKDGVVMVQQKEV